MFSWFKYNFCVYSAQYSHVSDDEATKFFTWAQIAKMTSDDFGKVKRREKRVGYTVIPNLGSWTTKKTAKSKT